MILNNVRAQWAYLNRPDDNGNFRISFVLNEQQEKDVKAELEKLCKANGTTLAECKYVGSYSATQGTYGAKMSATFTDKKTGETKSRTLPVFNAKAQRYAPDEIPNIANDSIVNVCVEPYFVNAKQVGKCAMLGLRSVQLVNFTEYSGGDSNPFKDVSDENPF